MKLKDIKKFNPEKIAQIETEMWRAYYGHRFLKLFLLLFKITREQFGAGYWRTFKISYFSALAAISFRKNQGKENQPLILKKLTKFYKNINDISLDKFDYKKVAQLELDWWLADRYPDRYEISRRQALANSIASLYNSDLEKFAQYADYRAQAMEMQDEAEKNKTEADWKKIEFLLVKSWVSLSEVVNGENYVSQ